MLDHWKIQTRILFLALVPTVIIVLSLSALYSWDQARGLENNWQERGKAIARQLAPACEYGVFSGNLEILQSLSDAALKEVDVQTVIITGDTGEILVHKEKNTKHQNPEKGINSIYSYQAPIYQSEFSVTDYVNTEDNKKTNGLPSQIGSVTIKLSGERLTQSRNQVFIRNFSITLIGLVITTFIVLHLSKGMVRTVSRLSTAVDKIRSGDLSNRVPLISGGELGILEEGINSMAHSLDQSQKREKKRTEDELQLEKIKAQVTLESIGDGVISTDSNGAIIYINQVAQNITGWNSEDAIGKHLSLIYNIRKYKDETCIDYPIELCLQRGEVIRNQDTHILANKNNRKYLIEDTASPILDNKNSIIGAVLVFRDVTEIRHMTRKMEFLAHHDSLTSLLNRNQFESSLQSFLDNARAGFAEHALCYVDLDQFKIVNDTCGHIAGDELLKQLSKMFGDRARDNDVLARLGGDEFGIIIEDCSVEEAIKIAEAFKQLISDFRFSWKNRSFEIGASIGLVPITASSGSMTDLLSAADSACYMAKDKGRNCVHLYQNDDIDLAKRHGEMQWVQRLKDAINNDNFILYCQKIVPITESDGTFTMCEILLRVQDNSIILPGAFMSAAERYYLMPEIDRWVVRNTFLALKEYFSDENQDGTNKIMRFSINLSGQSMCDEKFLDYVLLLFEGTSINPVHICFEITETAAIKNLTRAQEFISSLKKIGCKFALDDFGTGLSSFGYLKNLPVDYLKIDGGFISDIQKNPIDAAMVGAINEIGHIMNLKTIAESVENTSTAKALKLINVDYVQGLGISPVIPLSELLSSSENNKKQKKPSNN